MASCCMASSWWIWNGDSAVSPLDLTGRASHSPIANLVVTSNSEISGFNEAAIHLKLVFQNKTGTRDSTYLRLSLSEFNEIFSEIEKIKNLVELIG